MAICETTSAKVLLLFLACVVVSSATLGELVGNNNYIIIYIQWNQTLRGPNERFNLLKFHLHKININKRPGTSNAGRVLHSCMT